MSGPRLRFAEAVCSGHPDRLADSVADRIVDLALSHDGDALVAVEVALFREAVFVDGRIAAGETCDAAVSEAEVVRAVRDAYRAAGYEGPVHVPPQLYEPDPHALAVRLDLCLGPLGPGERATRLVADDQVIGVGYACRGERAGLIPLEQALARDFVAALEGLRRARPDLYGPDGKVLVAVQGRRLHAVALAVHHAVEADWLGLVAATKRACLAVADEYVASGELDPPGEEVPWLFNGMGPFSVGGPMADNGLSGKKLVAEAYGTFVPVGGGTVHGKDPKKPDVRAQRIARERAVALVLAGAPEATVWVVFRPGDTDPAWIEEG